MSSPTIKVIKDHDGEWAQMWVNGILYREGHNDYSDWYSDLIKEFLEIEIEYEEMCLDSSHSSCDCDEVE